MGGRATVLSGREAPSDQGSTRMRWVQTRISTHALALDCVRGDGPDGVFMPACTVLEQTQFCTKTTSTYLQRQWSGSTRKWIDCSPASKASKASKFGCIEASRRRADADHPAPSAPGLVLAAG